MKKSLVAAAVAVALLSACTPAAKPTPTPTPKPGERSFSTVAELKDAAVAAGYSCPSWTQDNRVVNAASSGSCSSADVFSVYLSEDAKERTVDTLKSIIPAGSGHLVIGPKWMINVANAESWATKLGATPVTW